MHLYLHIGSNKTGTSSLQNSLRHYYGSYPRSGREIGEGLVERHVGLRYALTPLDQPLPTPLRRFGIKSDDDRRTYKDAFIESFDKELTALPKDAPVIMSDEELWNCACPELARSVANFLRERFDEIKLVCYLRRPDKYLVSAYVQSIKMGGKADLPEFVKSQLKKRKPGRRLADWADAFGDENVIVRWFDGRALKDGDIVADFCSLADLPTLPAHRVNEGLSALGVEVLRNVNIAYRKKVRPRKYRAMFQKRFSGAGPHLTDELVRDASKALVDDYQEMCGRFNLVPGKTIYHLDDMTSAEYTPFPEAVSIAGLLLDAFHHRPLHNAPHPEAEVADASTEEPHCDTRALGGLSGSLERRARKMRQLFASGTRQSRF